jgi:hypothetical protein
MDNLEKEADKSGSQDGNILLLSDVEWTTEKLIDELQCNLALAEQIVTNKSGRLLTIRKYHSQCSTVDSSCQSDSRISSILFRS